MCVLAVGYASGKCTDSHTLPHSQLMLYVEEHPLAKRASQKVGSAMQGSGVAQSQQRSHVRLGTQEDDSIRVGERDIDAPLPQPSSSGAVSARKKRRRRADAGRDEGVESSASSGSESADSIQSVNDFAGYGKGAGSVGMSGVGM